MSIIKYPYYTDVSRIFNKGTFKGYGYKVSPKIPVRVSYNNIIHPIEAPARALVDSGADYCIFPSNWANPLGINIDDLDHFTTTVVGGNDVTTYLIQNIEIFLYNTESKKISSYKIEGYFCEGQEFPLLGRNFFQKIKKISFINNEEVLLEI